MQENKMVFYSKLIKIAIGVAFAILLIVLLSQYIQLAKLNNQNNALQSEYSTALTNKNELTEKKNGIEADYNQFVEDYAR